jgi:hypothetical protein
MSDKVVSQIFETTNYGQFTVLKENRGAKDSIKPRKIKHLMAIAQGPKYVPEKWKIDVNDKFVVIDGHHRLAVSKMLKLPIRYEIIKDKKFHNGQSTFINNVYEVNSLNTAWTSTDVFKAALAAKLPLANEIQKLISKHNNTFDHMSIIALIKKDPGLFRYAHGINVLTFEDKALLDYFHSSEFSMELASFISINNKLRIVSTKKRCISAVYEVIIYGSEFIDTAKFKRSVMKISDITLNNTAKTSNSKEWLMVLIRTYNSYAGTNIRLKTLLKAIKDQGQTTSDKEGKAKE